MMMAKALAPRTLVEEGSWTRLLAVERIRVETSLDCLDAPEILWRGPN